MKKMFVVSLLILACGCGSNSDSNGDGTIQFARSALQSLPQVVVTGTSSLSAMATGNISSFIDLANFFKRECHYGDNDFCGTINPATADNGFSATTLLGGIWHAQMYAGTLNKSCDGGTAATINATSFVANTAGGDPSKFIIDYYPLLSCFKKNTDASGGVTHSAYSADPNGAFLANLTTRYNYANQTDLFQVYTKLDNETPKFLAFNLSTSVPLNSRLILLVNLVDHKFAVKYSSGGKNIVGVGVGGISTDGIPNAGYYYARFFDNGSSTTKEVCVNNANNTYDDTVFTNCTISGASWSTTTDITTYLGMTAADITTLAGFVSFFDTEAYIGAAAVPAMADAATNFPASIQAAQ